jgi:hypothetical protein
MSVVLTTDEDAVRLLTMNRPEARNALSRELARALYAALRAADADEAVRAVVLTGADPAFCAGVDLKEAARDGVTYVDEFRSQSRITAVREMRTPIIGAINGAERAVFADTHAREPGPNMLGLKRFYTEGAAAVIDPALDAEARIAHVQHRDLDDLGVRLRAVTARNKGQIT